MAIVDTCCCCWKELPDPKDHCYVNFRYQVPSIDLVEKVLVAVVCSECGVAADNPQIFPTIEALIVARIIRIGSPDLLFTPRDRKDGD